jgi:hypothetical protein
MGLPRRHVQDVHEFSNDVGGIDAEVKAYFFSLDREQLNELLAEYGRKYSPQAESYARQTLPKWRSGTARMSGIVAKRLFDLLPPLMPLPQKFELAERVWFHFGPASKHEYAIGPHADIGRLIQMVEAKLDEVVVSHEMTETVPHRFHWLSSGDIKVKEQLLNHSRQIDKALAAQKLRLEIPVLQRQVREHPDVTKLARMEISVHKHSIIVTVEKNLGRKVTAVKSEAIISAKGQRTWLYALVGTVGLAFLLSREFVRSGFLELLARLYYLFPFS